MVKFLKKKVKSGFFEIKDADSLLSSHDDILAKIYRSSNAPAKDYKCYYLYSIKKMAELVQSLPASQNHHHNEVGGFLKHNLEVVELALLSRNKMLLPVGATVEQQAHKKAVYSFGVFVAAIMHDMGKIIADIEVFIFDKKYKEIGRHSPFVGSMLIHKNAKYYQYHYITNRSYKVHPLCSNILLTQLVNPVALDWIKKEPELFSMMLLTISGRSSEGGIVADIIKDADSSSSANSLKTKNINTETSQQQQQKSLADKLLDTLRYLSTDAGLKINTAGAAIYTTQTDVYYVSKKMIDLVRDTLHKDKQSGIPYDNARIMDEMLQFNIIVPTSENKAIWHTELIGGGFRNPTKLTMLRVPIQRIYLNNPPEPFKGEISILGDDNEVIVPADKNLEENVDQTNKQETKTGKSIETNQDNKIIEPKKEKNKITNDLPMPPGFATPSIKTEDKTANKQSENKKEDKIIVNADVEINNTTTEEELDVSLGEEFMQYLKSAINNKELGLNNAEAVVHIVEYAKEKALFLVSPKIFKEYNKDDWEQVQKQFTRTKYNEKSYNDDNIWKVQTTTNRTGKKPSIIKGYLISNLEELGFDLSALPSINNRIELVKITKNNL